MVLVRNELSFTRCQSARSQSHHFQNLRDNNHTYPLHSVSNRCLATWMIFALTGLLTHEGPWFIQVNCGILFTASSPAVISHNKPVWSFMLIAPTVFRKLLTVNYASRMAFCKTMTSRLSEFYPWQTIQRMMLIPQNITTAKPN